MNKIVEDLREHINAPKEKNWDFNSDKEYSFAVGQAVYYLFSLSKGNSKSESIINPFLNASKDEVIKRLIMQMYKKYNYLIEASNGSRSDKLLSHIMLYEPEKIYKEELMAGFVSNSLIYEKGSKEESEEI